MYFVENYQLLKDNPRTLNASRLTLKFGGNLGAVCKKSCNLTEIQKPCLWGILN